MIPVRRDWLTGIVSATQRITGDALFHDPEEMLFRVDGGPSRAVHRRGLDRCDGPHQGQSEENPGHDRSLRCHCATGPGQRSRSAE